MRYFVTGGAGFIGSHVIDRLLRSPSTQRVTAFDNLSSGKEEHLAHHRGDGRFTFVRGDLLDPEQTRKAAQGHDFVFHFAANADIAKGMVQTDLDLRLTTLATFNMLETMRQTGIRKIAYSSGSGIYGDVGTVPTAEDFGPLKPISMYGATKLSAEALISAFSHMFDYQSFIFRFANVVGHRQTHGVAYDFIRKLRKDPRHLEILGDGNQSKSYIHVTDVVDAMFFVIEKSVENVCIFNVATEDYVTVKQIAEMTIGRLGLKDVALVFAGGNRGWKGDVPVVRFNLHKIHAFGWKARQSSEQALLRSIEEMLTQAQEGGVLE